MSREFLARICGFTALSALAVEVGAQGVVYRDTSAGTVVVAEKPLWRTGQEWRIERRPVLSIGVVSGPEPYMLVNPGHAVVLSDDRVVIAENARSLVELRYYSADGVFIRAAGRFGMGPGEFQAVSRLFRLPGDTIVAFDRSSRKLTVFGPHGDFVRVIPLGAHVSPSAVAEALLYPQQLVISTQIPSGLREGVRQNHQRLAILNLDSGETTELATLGFIPSYFKQHAGGWFSFPLPFAPTSYVASSPNGVLWVGNSENYSIRALNRGIPMMTVRGSHVLQRVTANDQRRFKDRDLTYLPRQSEEMLAAKRVFHNQLRFPETMPAYHDLIADAGGNLWVMHYRPPWGPQVQKWNVHNPRGELLGTVQMPEETLSRCVFTRDTPCRSILDIGHDFVLVLTRDAYDVRRVAKHRLIKG